MESDTGTSLIAVTASTTPRLYYIGTHWSSGSTCAPVTAVAPSRRVGLGCVRQKMVVQRCELQGRAYPPISAAVPPLASTLLRRQPRYWS
ncbi:hypothetical protein [Luteitalea sp.]|uniref:hypothetical protein n=1 Tax=Luteitalea sp. TaxID=2004800 RepID=UPI0025B9D7C5|nr:hypothetical protein [Luteitalea sp.]